MHDHDELDELTDEALYTEAEVEEATELVRDEAYRKGFEAGRKELRTYLKALSRCNGSTHAVLDFLRDVHGVDEPAPAPVTVVKAVQSDPDPDPDDDDAPDDTDLHTDDDGADVPHIVPAEEELLAAAVEYAQECLDSGDDPEEGLHRLWAAFHDGETILKAWDSSKHPRSRDGRFLAKGDIEAAKSDPAKADALRAKVKPEDAGKLEDALDGKTDLRNARETKRDDTKAKRERVQASRTEAKRLAYKLLNGAGEPGDYAALIPHLSALTGKELSHVRLMLGASFEGKRGVEERRAKLLEYARGRVEEKPEEEVKPEPAKEEVKSDAEQGKVQSEVTPASPALVRHAIDVPKDGIFASGKKRSMFGAPSIAMGALQGANAVWHHQGDPNQTLFNAAQGDVSAYAKQKAEEIKAAQAAGYRFVNHRAGKYGTLYVLEKDGRVLTERGAAALVEGTGKVDLPADTTRSTAKPVIDAVNSFVQGLPESTRGNLGALVNAINRSPLGKHVELRRDEHGNIELTSKTGKWRITEPTSGHDAQGEWQRHLESSLPRFLAKLQHMSENEIPQGHGDWAIHDRAADARAVANDPDLAAKQTPPTDLARPGTSGNTPATPPQEAKPVTTAHIDLSDPVALTGAAHEAARGLPDYLDRPAAGKARHDAHKVPIADVYDALLASGKLPPGTDLDAFKAALSRAKAHAGLSRNDMPQYLTPAQLARVNRSETPNWPGRPDLGASHFLAVPPDESKPASVPYVRKPRPAPAGTPGNTPATPPREAKPVTAPEATDPGHGDQPYKIGDSVVHPLASVARELGITPQQAHDEWKAGRLRGYQIPGDDAVRVPQEMLDKYRREHVKPVTDTAGQPVKPLAPRSRINDHELPSEEEMAAASKPATPAPTTPPEAAKTKDRPKREPRKPPKGKPAPKPVAVEALAKDPGADKKHLQELAKQAPSDAAREALLDAEYNVPGADSVTDYTPAERRRQTLNRLAAAWRDNHLAGNTEGAEYVASAIAQYGGELHGPEHGATMPFDSKLYDSEHSVWPGEPVKVIHKPVVAKEGDGQYIAAKGKVGPVN